MTATTPALYQETLAQLNKELGSLGERYRSGKENSAPLKRKISKLARAKARLVSQP